MVAISGYQIINKIYESDRSLVYRALRNQDNQPVILKILKADYPTAEELIGYKQEYAITHSLNLAGVVRAEQLEKYQNTLVIIFEDFGGESLTILRNYCQFTLAEFLKIAIMTAASLGSIHVANIIHKDINPSNIVFNPAREQLKIIDFGISTILSRETPTIGNSNILEGTLAYISPEQTGRMNRTLDYRTDFYSLGVTFYELLTERLPFETDDFMELIHCHIAKQPIPLHVLRGEEYCPKAISDIVMKLMAKTAEERYQSAYGIKADLEECLRQLETTGKIVGFPLGSQDFSDKLQIPQKLYGRDREIATLLNAFERVSQGKSEMILVQGYSGIGKSSLVQEIYKPIAGKHGYFIKGKFEQYQRDIPYFAIIQALQELVQQILTESTAQLAQWREKLLATCGANGQVIIDVIPELELILGKQPAVPVLAPVEAQNRFKLVFQNFIRVFAQVEHPLAIFLDDLQWVDMASLQVIQLLMTAADSKYLLLIGAYRDHEVSAVHPLILTLNEMQRAGVVVDCISLPLLDINNINQLISETLNCTLEKTRPLAELVLHKTDGNPFFINEFLKSLYTENLLEFVWEEAKYLGTQFFSDNFLLQKGAWQWNLQRIQLATSITDNVANLLDNKIQKLSKMGQQVLQLAACIGNYFELSTLTFCLEKSPKEIVAVLREAIAVGLVMPVGNDYKAIELDIASLADRLTVEYKFVHDRIQQAAYSLIPAKNKQKIHRQIGQVLLQNTPLNQQHEKIFDIVNHLNFSIELLHYQSERDELAKLNFIAGRKAKKSTAYEPALKYLMVALNLLSKESWQRQYDLTLTLFVEAAEAAYLCSNFEQMERIAQVVLQQARTLLDKVKIYEVKILAWVAQGKPLEAVKTALDVLKLLGVSFPKQPSKLSVLLAAIATKFALRDKQIGDLINLPEMTDPYKLSAIQIIGITGSPAYNAAPEIVPLLAFQGINLSLKYGNAAMSVYGYASYGVMLCGVLGDIDSGYQFGKLALSLLEKFNAKELKSRTFMVFNNFIRHWKEHIRAGLQPLLEAYSSGLETGDLEFATYSAYIYCYHSYFVGKELTELETEMATYIHAINQFRQETALHLLRLYRQVVFNLLGQVENPCLLIGESYNEQIMLPRLLEVNHISAIFTLYFQKLILFYLFGQYPEAIKNAAMAEKYIDGVRAAPSVPLFHFYDSLAKLAIYASVSNLEQKHLLKKVVANQKKMKKWADHAPINHLHKFYLVEAERYRVIGQNIKAMDYYDRAIASAKKNEYLHEEALAHELAAKFYLDLNKVAIAQAYMLNARYCYLLWGAVAKVSQLDEKYPQLLFCKREASHNIIDVKSSTVKSTNKNSKLIDLNTVIKAAQVISGEIVFPELVDKLMKIVMENAGAETVFFLLVRGEKLMIETAGSVSQKRQALPQAVPVENSNLLPISVINYVARTQTNVILKDAVNGFTFADDPYIQLHKPKSVLCAPILNQSQLMGIVYLENNLAAGAFTSDRLETIQLLCSQAAISLKNAQLYQELQRSEAKERERAKQLEQSLQALQQAQAQLVQAQEQLLHDAFHDPLTGLPNRAWFMKRLEHAIELNKRYPDYMYAVLFIDLDRFKVVNESLGYLVGDELLKSVAIRLQAALQTTDMVARLGGDAFVILLEKIKDVNEATSMAERIQEQLRLPYQLYDYEVFTQASIGITLSTMNYERAIDVLRDADAAMYHAKEQFKGRYQLFAPVMQTRAIARLQLESDLRRAIELKEFSLYYQPIVELSSGRLSGFEALVRWHHRLKGWVSPTEFIPVAEETGLINSLGWWVLQQACLQLQAWQQQFPYHLHLAINVNLSVQQLKQLDLIERIKQILQASKLSGDCLKLEITESCLLETADLESQPLEQLKALGIRLCIDDFGTGYSSLSRLHDLPIDTLKIDRSFISRLETSSGNTEIVQAIITLAHSLGIDAVAEGIETPAQLEKLQELGCDLGQGYLFSKPVDSQTATQLL